MQEVNSLLLSEIKSKTQIKDLEDNYILEKIIKYFLTNEKKIFQNSNLLFRHAARSSHVYLIGACDDSRILE
jgi:hypothetical protein